MKWNKFRLKTTTEAEDIVSSMLMDLGIQGVEIEDKVPLTAADKVLPGRRGGCGGNPCGGARRAFRAFRVDGRGRRHH